MSEVKRGPGGKWLPGSSPNPSGRPKRVREVFEIAADASPRMIRILIQIAENEAEDSRARTAAAKVVVAYGCGEPQREVKIESVHRTEALSSLTANEIRAIAKLPLVEEREPPGDAEPH